ncbi:hypothetical protein Tco_0509616 [Tanacetum coccineum]
MPGFSRSFSNVGGVIGVVEDGDERIINSILSFPSKIVSGWMIRTLLWRNTSGSRKKKLENVDLVKEISTNLVECIFSGILCVVVMLACNGNIRAECKDFVKEEEEFMMIQKNMGGFLRLLTVCMYFLDFKKGNQGEGKRMDAGVVRIIMLNVIPPDHVDDVAVVEPNQHDDVPIVSEPVLEDEDEDPEEEEFEDE